MQSTLFILGAGVYSHLQLTLETVQALRSCQTVFVLHSDSRVIDSIGEYCNDVRSLFDLYEDRNQKRMDIYKRIADRVVEVASNNSRTAFLVFGHPFFLVSACEYAAERGRGAGFNVRTLPAISTFDTLLTDLQHDLGYAVQIYCAQNLVRNEFVIDARVPLLLFQLTQFENEYLIDHKPQPPVFEPLVTYLLRYFPADHNCTMVHSAAHLLEKAKFIEFPLSHLCERDDLMLELRPTLYLPGL